MDHNYYFHKLPGGQKKKKLRVFLGSTLLSIVKTSFSLFPPYFRDLELDVLEDIFPPCGSRKERQAAAKDTTKEEDEAKAIVAKEETSEESTTAEGAKKAG